MKTRRKKRKVYNRTQAEIGAAHFSTCVHEAGHAVISVVLKPPDHPANAAAVVLDTPGRIEYRPAPAGGLAYSQSGLSDFDDAIVIAAGEAATDFLLPAIRPPAIRAPRRGLLKRTIPGGAESLEADCADPGLVEDEVKLARFCIEGRERNPEQWAGRHSKIVYHAALLVKENARRIIEAADELFATGLVLPSRWKIIFGPLPPLPPERFKTPPVSPAQPAGESGIGASKCPTKNH